MSAAQIPLILAIPASLFLLSVPGFITYNLILSGKPSDKLLTAEKVFWSVALSLMLNAWVALILASLGVYSGWALVGIMLVWTLGGSAWLWKRNPAFFSFRYKRVPFRLPSILLVLLLLGTTCLFYLAPHETVVGAQDSGVYYNTGVNIARTGKLIIDDPLLPTMPQVGEGTYPLLLLGFPGGAGRYLFADFQRINGFYVMDESDGLTTGKVIPQFFHLYPAALAVGYSLFGFYGALAITPLLGIMGVFAVYLTALRLFSGKRGEWVALLAGLLLALNGLQVWFVRQTLWETIGQFLTFTAIYSFTILIQPNPPTPFPIKEGGEDTLDKTQNLGAFGAGAGFGLLCLAHASQFPIILGIVLPYFIWMRLTRRWGEAQWWMAITFGVLVLHTVLHIRLFSLAYWEGVYHNKLRDYLAILHYIIPIAAVGLIVLIIADAMPKQLRWLESWIAKHGKWFCWLIAGVVGFYFLYNYFVRIFQVGTDGRGNPFEYLLSWQSYIGAPTSLGPERNLMRVGWYFSPIGIVLMILGVVAMVARKLTPRTAMFLALAIITSYMFIDENYTQEGYIYSLRRYVNVTVPAFSIFMAYAALEVLPDLGSWAGRLFSRFFSRKVVYAQTAGAPGANIAFTVTDTPEKQTVPQPQSDTVLYKGKGARIGLWLGLVTAAGLCLFMVVTNRTLYTLSEYGTGPESVGMVKQLEDLANRFGPNDIIIFSGERDADAKPATALTYMFNRPSFVLTNAPSTSTPMSELLDKWEKQGYHIKAMLGPDGGRFLPSGYNLTFESEVNLHFHQFENLATQKPFNVQENDLFYGIYSVTKQQTPGTVGSGQGTVGSGNGWNLQIGERDYAALVSGFSSIEKEKDGTEYRWAYQNGVLRVPCIPTGSHSVQVTLDPGATRPPTLSPLKLTAYLSNYLYDADNLAKLTPLGIITVQPGAKTYTLDIPQNYPTTQLTCNPGTGSLILQLVSDKTWQPANYNLGNDRRPLGVKVLRVSVK